VYAITATFIAVKKEEMQKKCTSTYAAALSAGRAGGNQSLDGLLRFSVTNQCSDGHPAPNTSLTSASCQTELLLLLLSLNNAPG